jgi:hypothetical protein
MSEWSKYLKPGRYAYREIPIYPKANFDSLNPYEYIRSTVIYQVPQSYTNRDLPNLRAMFVKEDLIDPFLSGCNTSQNVETHILEGHEFAEIDQLKRKAQIYILLF